MRARERNGGYTLMELMVTITAAAIVLGAAATVLLLGLRMNRATGESVKRRQNVRTVLTMVENLAGSGSIGSVETSAESWTVKDTGDAPTTILKWSNGAITAGDTASPLLEDVESSAIYWDARSKLLTLAVELDGESYATSVHCRGSEITVKDENELDNNDKIELGWNDAVDTVVELVEGNTKVAEAVRGLAGADGRRKLLTVLLSQYGSTGEIKHRTDSEFTYYSEWYTDSKNYADWPGWNRYTPWCACFLSWGVAQTGAGSFNTNPPKFASTGLMLNWFQSRDETYWYGSGDKSEPEPGDYVFFDWDKDGDPDHVGAVLYCGTSNVYTVEGNSGGKVALRRYGKNDERILGYGVLDWKTAAAETPAG